MPFDWGDIAEGVIISLITGFLIFFAGVFLSPPIREKIGEWQRAIESKMNPAITIPVRIFFILCPLCSNKMKNLIVKQNKLQNIFRFDIAEFKLWDKYRESENRLELLQTMSRLEFCEKFLEEMENYNRDQGQEDLTRINLAITQRPFPKNWYTWNTKDRKGIVIGIYSLSKIKPDIIDKIVLRIIQRMSIYSLGIKDLTTHELTVGCLFDNTSYLSDIEQSVENNYICDVCKKIIIDERGEKFFNNVNEWINNSFR